MLSCWVKPRHPGKPPSPGHGSIPAHRGAVLGCKWPVLDSRGLTQHHCEALGTECLDWWGHSTSLGTRGTVQLQAQPWRWGLGLNPGGIVALTQHLCALSADDCKNIANIMKTLAHRGFIFKQTSKPF